MTTRGTCSQPCADKRSWHRAWAELFYRRNPPLPESVDGLELLKAIATDGESGNMAWACIWNSSAWLLAPVGDNNNDEGPKRKVYFCTHHLAGDPLLPSPNKASHLPTDKRKLFTGSTASYHKVGQTRVGLESRGRNLTASDTLCLECSFLPSSSDSCFMWFQESLVLSSMENSFLTSLSQIHASCRFQDCALFFFHKAYHSCNSTLVNVVMWFMCLPLRLQVLWGGNHRCLLPLVCFWRLEQ